MMGNLKKALIVLGILTALLIVQAGCSRQQANFSSGSMSQGKIQVAVSIVPQETFVRAVARERAEVTVLIPPGRSPENFAPSIEEMEKLSRAAVYFAAGVPAEKAAILPRVREWNKDVYIVDQAAAAARVYPDREFAPGFRDHHIWLSPRRAAVMVENIADELSRLDPAYASFYRDNAREYIAQLERLDQEIRTLLGAQTQRAFIISHPALGYFADDYGLKMLALEEEGKEAAPRHLQEVIEFARKENIKVVFYQKETGGKQAEIVAAELGGRAESLDPLASDYIDNLRRIAQAIAAALQENEPAEKEKG